MPWKRLQRSNDELSASSVSKMVLSFPLPRTHRFHGRALALVPSSPSLLRQVGPRHRPTRSLTIISSLHQKHSQLDLKVLAQRPPKPEPLESINPETLQKIGTNRFSEGQKKDSLLIEQDVSNKEQRKADWAIMKEMSRYLWPKVEKTCRAAL